MYKLTKGIKKKVKGKKKPTQEELEQEELRQYRLEKQREREQRDQEQAEQISADHPSGEAADTDQESPPIRPPPPESDEWAKFRQLTSGVDSVLSSTKESLQTIKETSYFKRKKVGSEQPTNGDGKDRPAAATVTAKPKWVDVDAEEEAVAEPEPELNPEPEDEPPRTPTPERPGLAEVLCQVERLERAQYFEEDVFNTEYVDTVTSGDIGLAVIPDSPTDSGDDPFDTSAVDQLLCVKPEDPKKKKLRVIALGNAVGILSGTQECEKHQEQKDHSEPDSKKHRRRQRGTYKRPGSLDLLQSTEIFADPEEKSPGDQSVDKETAVKTLLDEDIEDDGEFELNLAVTPEIRKHNYPLESVEPGATDEKAAHSARNHISNLVSEFDYIAQPPSTGSNEAILCAKSPDEDDCEFDSLATESLLRAKDREEILGEDDPFDTSAVQQVLGQRDLAEEAQFGQQSAKFDADFGETKPAPPGRPPPPVVVTSPEKEQPDLLTSNQHHDYEPLPEPISFSSAGLDNRSATTAEEQKQEIDPFDTSAADQLCGTEIRLLEAELLNSLNEPSAGPVVDDAFEDKEFDPRADKEQVEAEPFDTSCAGGIVRGPPVDVAQLLASTPIQDSTPVFLPFQQSDSAASQPEADPFDTSIADSFGDVELKVLESELLAAHLPIAPASLSAQLDLTATSAPPPRPPPPAPSRPTAFSVSFDEKELPKPPPPPELLTLTPVGEDAAPVALVPQRAGGERSPEEQDPFDTSIADKFGAVEVEVLERELLAATPAPVAKQLADLLPTLVSDSAFNYHTDELAVLSPLSAEEEPPEEEDVFDTTHVKAVCIVDSPTTAGDRPTKPLSLSVSTASAALLATTPEDPNPPLQPCLAPTIGSQDAGEDVDPFDTSVADQFGHTELRVLENELVGGVSCSRPPPRPPSPRPAPASVSLPPPPPETSADQLLAVTPSADLPPALQPSGRSATPRQLSPVTLDPFDTSIADRYGTAELRVLEREFAADAPSSLLKRAVSEPEFDQRGDEKVARPATPPPDRSLLDEQAAGSRLTQTLTATVVSVPPPAQLDPFDTSIADGLVPGRAELLVLERELLDL